ncbi:MAG: NADH-quinone oxidoreductase subunit, partial [Solirubrobacteraceae bacterium]|nr:NADH-quinone oxidoreductase subunit [Solirubrobacteraceae bacterium]
VTAFMAVATKVAALGVFLRFFDVALLAAHASWGPAVAVLAAITILVGNVGALGQSSLKRMLAYSSVAQAGYMLAGVVVATQLGVKATVFYLAVYLFMNMAAFAVIVVRERESGLGDSVAALAGLGRDRPLLAWPMTISMLALAGIPATAGFIGKFYLIDASVQGGYTWLGVAIVVGIVGALGQSSLKRLLAYSSVAQAGYMLAGVVVASRLGLQATVFYLAVYLVMNLAAFAVIVARERETPLGDDVASLNGLGATRPLLAWPMTIAMLALAGFPATAGFIGKFYLIDAAVTGGYAWLGVVIVIGSMISLAYYLKVVAAIWMSPAAEGAELTVGAGGAEPVLAGGSQDATGMRAQGEVVAVAVLFGVLTIVLGVVPSPLFHVVRDAGAALGLL